ncbi:class I SAM-dependent methyltransferase [Methylohalobius crimeensis]|uniref:class I SAM-dependent methyltransferase n=1 Tax=Methylohalobius crimeensis TaxID=244365 RepID=UPI0003B6880D|nr:class I SAM-dependent methyltransferase [Methylohalobius crimeensis]
MPSYRPFHSPRRALRRWYRTPLGRRLRQLEATYLNRAIKVPYSFTLVQLGLLGWEKRYLDPGYLPQFCIVDESPITPNLPVIRAQMDSLPLASESIDVLILPHTLEYASDQHQLLREAERILKPEGQLLILGFHPWSFYRLYRWLPGNRHDAPWRGRAVSRLTLMDRLNLLNFAAEVGAQFDFNALHSPSRWNWLHLPGAPLWTVGYAVHAIKRTYTVIPITPTAEKCPGWVPGIASTAQRRTDDSKHQSG